MSKLKADYMSAILIPVEITNAWDLSCNNRGVHRCASSRRGRLKFYTDSCQVSEVALTE